MKDACLALNLLVDPVLARLKFIQKVMRKYQRFPTITYHAEAVECLRKGYLHISKETNTTPQVQNNTTMHCGGGNGGGDGRKVFRDYQRWFLHTMEC